MIYNNIATPHYSNIRKYRPNFGNKHSGKCSTDADNKNSRTAKSQKLCYGMPQYKILRVSLWV